MTEASIAVLCTLLCIVLVLVLSGVTPVQRLGAPPTTTWTTSINPDLTGR